MSRSMASSPSLSTYRMSSLLSSTALLKSQPRSHFSSQKLNELSSPNLKYSASTPRIPSSLLTMEDLMSSPPSSSHSPVASVSRTSIIPSEDSTTSITASSAMITSSPAVASSPALPIPVVSSTPLRAPSLVSPQSNSFTPSSSSSSFHLSNTSSAFLSIHRKTSLGLEKSQKIVESLQRALGRDYAK